MTQPCVNAGEDANHRKRVAVLRGPRLGWWCATCWRGRGKATKAARKAVRLERVYGLAPEDVEAVRATMPVNQAGHRVCPICERATGARKALAADHDHDLERQGLPIRETVRGFLCGPCNQMIGRFPAHVLRRALAYLENPPAFDALHTNGR